MTFLSSIDDRYLLLLLTILFAVAFWATRDKAFSDMATLALGVTIGVLKDHASRTLVVGDSTQTQAIVKDFLAKS